MFLLVAVLQTCYLSAAAMGSFRSMMSSSSNRLLLGGGNEEIIVYVSPVECVSALKVS